jgi:hypothetical protein
MPRSRNPIQDWYTKHLREYFTQRYHAYLRNEDDEGKPNELGPSATLVARPERDQLPEAVREAHAFYAKHFEETDLGSAQVWHFVVDRKPTYAIRVTTDGDDGFVELYDKKGTFLAAARRYIEVVVWGSRDWLREQATHPWDLPAELEEASRQTLWGRPVEGFHCMETHDHACNASPPGCCGEGAGHLRDSNSPHRCSQCGFTWGGQPPPPAPPKREIVPWWVQILFIEDGSFNYKLTDTPITIVTKDGKATVPVAEVQQIDFATRPGGAASGAKKPRKSDVVRTADNEWSGTLEGDALETHYPGSGSQKLWFADMKKLRPLTEEEVDEETTFTDPGTLITEGNSVGQTRKYRVTGGSEGPVYGTGTYDVRSTLAAAVVHAGVLQVGECGVVELEFVSTPPKFKGSTRNGITSESGTDSPWTAFRILHRTDK